MSAREAILARVRANRPSGSYELPSLPKFVLEQPGGLVASFSTALAGMGGKVIVPTATQDVAQVIRTQFPEAGVVILVHICHCIYIKYVFKIYYILH